MALLRIVLILAGISLMVVVPVVVAFWLKSRLSWRYTGILLLFLVVIAALVLAGQMQP